MRKMVRETQGNLRAGEVTLYLDCGGEDTTICICQNSENRALKNGEFYSM